MGTSLQPTSMQTTPGAAPTTVSVDTMTTTLVSTTSLQPTSMRTTPRADPTTVSPRPAVPWTTGTKTFQGLGVTLELEQDNSAGEVILRLTGPDDVWFAIGFDAFAMAQRPYVIIVDGSTGEFQ